MHDLGEKRAKLWSKFFILSLFSLLIPINLLAAPLKTYFVYSPEELTLLDKYSPKGAIEAYQLDSWDRLAYDLIRSYRKTEHARVMAYLIMAQYDAAVLSALKKGQFSGSLDPISRKVLQLFFPNIQIGHHSESSDPYSEILANIVMTKIKARYEEEQKHIQNYPQKVGAEFWIGEKPYVGLATGSFKPWILKSSDQFRAPMPPPDSSPVWKQQLAEVVKAMTTATPLQKEQVFFWAGMTQKGKLGSDWIEIAKDYYQRVEEISVDQILLIRAALAIGITDAMIAVFDSKYTYWVKRPSMMDPSIKPMIPLPNHPSYPAGHSTASASAATILTYFFPDKKNEWWRVAEECGLSRITAGVHFPIDNEAGREQGSKVGRAVVSWAQQ